MTEQAEWELVDEAPARAKREEDAQSGRWQRAGTGARHSQRLPKGPLLQAILGKGWRWKTAVLGASAAVILAFMATVAAVAVLAAAAGATLLLAVGKLRQMAARAGSMRASAFVVRHPGK